MIRKNIKILIVTSVIILLPILAGLILWNKLPEQLPIHWNSAGEIDDWSSKAFAVFFVPLILLAVQWLCIFASLADPKKQNHSSKILHLVFWIIPILSIVLNAIVYATALNKAVRIEVIMPVLIGFLFAIIGNYLPKCKQNYTIGIKLPWTLNSEENWNRTHRFAGRIWLICGLIIMLTGFLGSFWIIIVIAILMVLIPFIYSYMLHRKGI